MRRWPVAEMARVFENGQSPTIFRENQPFKFWADDAFPKSICWILRGMALNSDHTTAALHTRKADPAT